MTSWSGPPEDDPAHAPCPSRPRQCSLPSWEETQPTESPANPWQFTNALEPYEGALAKEPSTNRNPRDILQESKPASRLRGDCMGETPENALRRLLLSKSVVLRLPSDLTRSYNHVFAVLNRQQPTVDKMLARLTLPTGMAEIQKQISQQVAETTRVMRRMATTVAEPLVRLATEYERVLPGFLAAMTSSGWPPPADEVVLGIGTMRSVSNAWDTGDEDEVRRRLDAIMLERHDGEVLEAVKTTWSEKYLLRRRASILEAGVMAHLGGNYACSVPTILTQVEGILADGFSHSGRMNGTKYLEYLDQLLPPTDEEGLRQKLDAVLHSFFITVLLAPFDHGASIPVDVSRHAILHGADISYATEITSLKAVLTVNALQNSFQLVALRGGSVFHHAGCRLIASSRREREHFQRREKVISEGLRPCKVCRPNKIC